MARALRLKVYRTPIGFHDAYVAAPSQKAALVAWGSAHDLFTTGEAEVVTDPALTDAPLAVPGQIVRRVRGTAAEHIAALPPEPAAQPNAPQTPPPAAAHQSAAPKAKPAARIAVPPEPAPRPPKPDQRAVDAARVALAAALDQQQRERSALAQRERDLRHERQALAAAHKTAASSLRKDLKAAEAEYSKAFATWQKTGSTSAVR